MPAHELHHMIIDDPEARLYVPRTLSFAFLAAWRTFLCCSMSLRYCSSPETSFTSMMNANERLDVEPTRYGRVL